MTGSMITPSFLDLPCFGRFASETRKCSNNQVSFAGFSLIIDGFQWFQCGWSRHRDHSSRPKSWASVAPTGQMAPPKREVPWIPTKMASLYTPHKQKGGGYFSYFSPQKFSHRPPELDSPPPPRGRTWRRKRPRAPRRCSGCGASRGARRGASQDARRPRARTWPGRPELRGTGHGGGRLTTSGGRGTGGGLGFWGGFEILNPDRFGLLSFFVGFRVGCFFVLFSV